MIELLLGIILILILLTGTLQFLTVAGAHTRIDSGIRGKTGFLAMSPRTEEDTPRCIANWQPGPDGQRFTADDQVVPGSPNTVAAIANGSVASATDWKEFGLLTRPSSLAALHDIPVPLMSLGFIGIRWSTTVPVSAIAQELFYGKSDVTVQEDAWIPIMNGLY